MATNLISRVDDYQRTLITNPMTGMRESVLVEQIRGKEISRTEKKYSTFAASSFNAGYLQSSSQILKYIVNGRLGQVIPRPGCSSRYRSPTLLLSSSPRSCGSTS